MDCAGRRGLAAPYNPLMRSLSFALIALGLGLLFGFVLFSSPEPVQRAPVATLATPPSATNDPDQPRQSTPRSPEHPKPQLPRRDLATKQALVRHQLFEEIRKRDVRIHDLEQELGVLKKSLPPSALLQDLERATVQELVDIVGALRKVGQKRLLAVPEEVLLRYAALLRREDFGAARLLPRGEYDNLVAKRGGGAYFSFATRENDYNKEPDIELQHGYYSTSFYGGTFGFLLDLGPLPLDNVPTDAKTPPGALPADKADAWALLWEAIPPNRGGRRAYEGRGNRLGLRDRAKAEADHTYLLRAVLPGEHDILVAFRDVHRDDHGHTLVFRELSRWDSPR